MFLYITYTDLKRNYMRGIHKKVLAQMKVFEKKFGESYYTLWHNKTAYLMNGDTVKEEEVAVTRHDYRDILISWMRKYNVTYTYIRYPLSNMAFADLLKFQKSYGIKSVLEIPTFPYEGELSERRLREEDRYFINVIEDKIDIISTYSKHTSIWGKKTIRLLNGIDLDSIPVKKKSYSEKKLSLIAVASMACWHGYERIICGIHEYYKKGGDWSVTLDLIGEGVELPMYKKLCEDYHLQPYIRFCGALDGDELTRHFDCADVAVSSLGLYKTGLESVSPIKNAEYCARGIPIIVGYESIGLPDDLPFILRVSNDSTSVNVEQVIDFYRNIVSQEDYMKQIRNYAESHFGWERIMQPVIDYLL